MTTKNEYIASIMLEAAKLLKNDNESLNEAYVKDSYDLVKDDFRTIKNNMIKANNLRMQSKFNESKKLLNETFDIVINTKNKVKNMDDPELLQRIISSVIGNVYVGSKSKLQNKSYGSQVTITAAPDKGLKGMKKVIDKYLNACGIDIKNMFELCKKGYTKKLKNKTDVFIKERGAYNYNLLNKAYKKQKKEATKATLQEAIDLLYDKAILCEDSSETEGYVQKAEELQKAIEDIPVETLIKQDDYNTATVGGDEKPDLDEIKDLCDNDPEVIKLLTDDEDKSVTVDSDGETNTESYSWFY